MSETYKEYVAEKKKESTLIKDPEVKKAVYKDAYTARERLFLTIDKTSVNQKESSLLFRISCDIYNKALSKDNSKNLKIVNEQLIKILENELTENQKAVVIERLFNNKKLKDISSELGIDISVASRHYEKGIEKIRKFAKYLEPFLR